MDVREAMGAMAKIDPAGNWVAMGSMLGKAFEQMEWAEDEISYAEGRFPSAADRIHASFRLCMPPLDMPSEAVFRAHCREMLERVAAGEDTRPPTAAEICTVCMNASQVAPFNPGGFLVYMRAFRQVFPTGWRKVISDEDLEAEERVNGYRADEIQRKVVHRLTVKNRRPGKEFDMWPAEQLAGAMVTLDDAA